MWKLFWIYHRLSLSRTHIMHITVSSTSCIFFVPYIDFVKAVESNWRTSATRDAPMHSTSMCWCVGVLRGQTAMRSERDRIARPTVGNVAKDGTNSESGLFVVIYWLVCRTWKNENTKRHTAAASLPRARRHLHATHSHHTLLRSIDAVTHSDWFYRESRALSINFVFIFCSTNFAVQISHEQKCIHVNAECRKRNTKLS